MFRSTACWLERVETTNGFEEMKLVDRIDNVGSHYRRGLPCFLLPIAGLAKLGDEKESSWWVLRGSLGFR